MLGVELKDSSSQSIIEAECKAAGVSVTTCRPSCRSRLLAIGVLIEGVLVRIYFAFSFVR
jgi:hypothetical protein